METIKKFKNGKIKLEFDKYFTDREGKLTDDYYFNNMNMYDLYFNQINGYIYIVDFNTNLVYELDSQYMQNPLRWLLDIIQENRKYYLYPLPKESCKILIQDLGNGF